MRKLILCIWFCALSLPSTICLGSSLLQHRTSLTPRSALQPAVNPIAFGQASLTQSSAGQVAFQFTTATATPKFSMAYGLEFSVTSTNCPSGSSNCIVSVMFSPAYPGLRQDAVVAKDSAGRIIATTQVYGIGQGPQAILFPGVISTPIGFNPSGYGFGGDGGPASKALLRVPQGVAIDAIGNVFIADSLNNVIRRVDSTTGKISTVAGNNYYGFQGDGNLAKSAELGAPTGVAVDGAGNLFIADNGNNVIRRVDAASGYITTVAGGGTSGLGDNGPATAASLWGPTSVALDAKGNLYIADALNNLIRKVDATGTITTVAGGGNNPGTDGLGDGGPAIGCPLSAPSSIALDSAGNLYIADTGNNIVRQVSLTTGTIAAVAGNGSRGFGGSGVLATTAQLSSPSGVAIDAAGNIYIADSNNNVIRKVDAGTGIVTIVAGSGAAGFLGDGLNSLNAALYAPMSLALDNSGSLYFADYGNNVVRKITSTAAPLSFPSVSVGASTDAQTVNVSNIGNQPLSLTSLSTSAGFTQLSSGQTACGSQMSLAVGVTCTVSIAFSPSVAGAVSGSANITDNSLSKSASLQSVGLSGSAVGAPCSYSLSQSTANAAAAASTGSLTVNANANSCAWTASSGASWLTIAGSASATGTGTLNYAVATNPSSSTRTGSLTIAGQTFTVTQTGVALPTVSGDSPAAGSGLSQIFTFTFSDPRGATDFGIANILINSGLDGRQACYIAYSAPANTLYLVADNGSDLSAGLVLNGSGSLANSQCTISGSKSSALASGTTLTLKLNIAFSSAFAGNKTMYLAIRDVVQNNSGWQPVGVWQVPGAVSTTTTGVSGMSPQRGSGHAQTFTYTFTDTKGWQDIGVVNSLLNASLDGVSACYVAYSSPGNTVYLVNDDGSTLSSGLLLNGSGSIANSQCTISGQGSSAAGSGNKLTLVLNMTFSSSFSGNRVFYVAARDQSQTNNTGWQTIGSWNVQ